MRAQLDKDLGIPLPKPIQGFQPSTFLERGIAVPFTTPYLVGARLRPRERRGVELVVPNPSGGRGVYIMPWDGVHALCSPTLHDRRLNAKLAALPAVQPSALRRAALEVAAEGMAGRDAIAAARSGLQQEEFSRLHANFELLLAAIRTVEQRGTAWSPPDLTDRDALETRARQALAALGPRIGLPSEDLWTAIEELAAVFSPIGVGQQARTARLPGLMAQVEGLQRHMAIWKRSCGEESGLDAELVEVTAERTLRLARSTMAEAEKLLEDLPGLLRSWLNDSAKVSQLAARPEWLLDGWERICLLWRTADETFGRPATLREIVNLVPTTPREAFDWADIGAEMAAEALPRRRKVALGEDWRTGVTAFDLIARNERLRALSPAGPA